MNGDPPIRVGDLVGVVSWPTEEPWQVDHIYEDSGQAHVTNVALRAGTIVPLADLRRVGGTP
jgi:hypothetical protein